MRNTLFSESQARANLLNNLFRTKGFNFIEFVFKLFEPYFTTNVGSSHLQDNIELFGPQILDMLASVSDLPLFRSVMNLNPKPIMANMKKLYAMAADHYPTVANCLEIIIKNNGDKVSKPQPPKTTAGKPSDPKTENLDEVSLIQRELAARKNMEVQVKDFQKGQGSAQPGQDPQIRQDFENLPGEKLFTEYKKGMKQGVGEKLRTVQDRREQESLRTKNEKLQKDQEHRDQMVN